MQCIFPDLYWLHSLLSSQQYFISIFSYVNNIHPWRRCIPSRFALCMISQLHYLPPASSCFCSRMKTCNIVFRSIKTVYLKIFYMMYSILKAIKFLNHVKFLTKKDCTLLTCAAKTYIKSSHSKCSHKFMLIYYSRCNVY